MKIFNRRVRTFLAFAMSVILIFPIISTCSISSVYAAEEQIGDLDASGAPDAKDALLILKSVARLVTLNDTQKRLADVNTDKSIDAKDSLDILMLVTKIIDEFVPRKASDIDPSSNLQEDVSYIATEFYTLKVPKSWPQECYYDVFKSDNYYHCLTFYEKNSYDESLGGRLFSIHLLPEFDDYTIYPSYEVLGSLVILNRGSFNLIVMYPTDVQYSDTSADNYLKMQEAIPDILDSIEFNNSCTFSNNPL